MFVHIGQQRKWRIGGSHFLEGKLDTILSHQSYPTQEILLLIKVHLGPQTKLTALRGLKCGPGNLKLQERQERQRRQNCWENRKLCPTHHPIPISQFIFFSNRSLPFQESRDRKNSSGYHCRAFSFYSVQRA
jgi:hypothetical protein